MFESLENAIRTNDEAALQDAIFELGFLRNDQLMIPDEVTFKIIDALRQENMYSSALSGHLLNHFEFHSQYISATAKNRCIGFLQTWGDHFSHVHSQQVVAELRTGSYLSNGT